MGLTKRLVAAVVAAAVLPLLFGAGCERQRLSFVAWDYKMKGEREFYERLVRDFQAARPGVEIEFTLGEWSGSKEQKPAHDLIRSWVADGTGPDVVVMPDIWITEFAPHIEPYGDHAPPGKASEYFPVLYEKGVFKGKWLGPVWATSTKALVYRSDLFRKAGLQPPRTWNDLLDCARKLNDPPRVFGFGLAGKKDYDTTDNFYYFFWSAGGELIGPDGKSAVNGPEGVKALGFMRDLIFKYRVVQAGFTEHHRHDVERLFEQGKIAMTENGPWMIENLRKRAPNIEFAVAPIPVDKRPVTQIITDHIIIMKYSPRKRLAADFVTFATQDKYRLAFCKLGMVPEKPAVAKDAHFQRDPAWRVFVDIIPTGKSIPKLPWEKVELATQEALHAVYCGKLDVKTALDRIASAINAVIEEQKSASD